MVDKLDVTVAKETSVFAKLEFVVDKLDVTVAKETSVFAKLVFVVAKLDVTVAKETSVLAKLEFVVDKSLADAIALTALVLPIYQIPSDLNTKLPETDPPDSTSIPEPVKGTDAAPLLSLIILSQISKFVTLSVVVVPTTVKLVALILLTNSVLLTVAFPFTFKFLSNTTLPYAVNLPANEISAPTKTFAFNDKSFVKAFLPVNTLSATVLAPLLVKLDT